ncbi:MAG: hypothetical protein COT74_02130 [Bdellovibrionales bacterium CG10_big_fil_rev_8_21_14_0_10_45_34]|nr:MAG: hypothetical protein COT74_02130 [Bdellovibrionales bacterium CG10_big_fil_rev_8_21_14_0_10_45_34]
MLGGNLNKCSNLLVHLVCSALFFSVALLKTEASAQEANSDVYDLPKLVAVQNRAYLPADHLTVQAGYLPIDAFNKAVITGLSYTYQFSEFTAWEIINANYAFNVETDLKGDLRSIVPNLEVLGERNSFLDYINWYATTNFIYTPLYNKSLLFNKGVVHSETSFLVGAGVGQFQFGGMRPLVSLGLISRYFLSESTSLKFDVREHIYVDDAGVNGILSLIVGFAFNTGTPVITSASRVEEASPN